MPTEAVSQQNVGRHNLQYETIRVSFQGNICFLQLYRPEANNTINTKLINECHSLLDYCENEITVIVISGLPEIFCFGADFFELQKKFKSVGSNGLTVESPEPLYKLWYRMATGPYVTVSHVRGKVNAGGIGFVAASDMVLADITASFSLSEMLFGLIPACVMPFLIRKIGLQKANYLSLSTQAIDVTQAASWGLVDAFDTNSNALLRKHLLRIRYLTKTSVKRYKHFLSDLSPQLSESKARSIATNIDVFSDTNNINGIVRYMEEGKFPWEP